MTKKADSQDISGQRVKDRNQEQWIETISKLKRVWHVLTDPSFSGYIQVRVDGKNGTAGAIRVTIDEYTPPKI